MLFVATLFSLNVFATDYNNVVGINVNDENQYYSMLGGGNVAWKEQVAYWTSHGIDSFEIVNGIVVYENHILLDRAGNMVLEEHEVRAAAGTVYSAYKIDELIDVENNKLFFNFNPGVTFMTLYSIGNYCSDLDLFGVAFIKNSMKYSYTYDGYVLFDISILEGNKDTTEVVLSSSECVYDVVRVCEHEIFVSNPTVIQTATCTESGINRYFCLCRVAYEDVDIGTNGYNHDWIEVERVNSTCKTYGYVKYQCSICSSEDNSIIYPYHVYSDATCTEASKCNICGREGYDDALGHDTNFLGKCKREGCNYSKVKIGVNKAANATGGFFNNLWNGTKNVSSSVVSGVAKGGQKIVYFFTGNKSGADDDISGIGQVWYMLVLVLTLIPVIALVYVIVYFAIKVKKRVNKDLSGNEVKRRRRKRK